MFLSSQHKLTSSLEWRFSLKHIEAPHFGLTWLATIWDRTLEGLASLLLVFITFGIVCTDFPMFSTVQPYLVWECKPHFTLDRSLGKFSRGDEGRICSSSSSEVSHPVVLCFRHDLPLSFHKIWSSFQHWRASSWDHPSVFALTPRDVLTRPSL